MRTLHPALAALIMGCMFTPFPSSAESVEQQPGAEVLATSPQWLTTRVYVEGDPQADVKARYPGVVGISMWDPYRNRYEFFYADTGISKHAHGGGGYFLVTGDGKTHILVPDLGPHRTVVRRLEKLDDTEFTYSREVPRDMMEGSPAVRIYVVHAPYDGPLTTTMTERSSTGANGSANMSDKKGSDDNADE